MTKPDNIFVLFCSVTGSIEYSHPDEASVLAVYRSIPEDLRSFFEVWTYAPLLNNKLINERKPYGNQR